MKLLYFGTICNIEEYQKILKNCKTKPTVATVVFESALMDGFSKNGVDIEINSFPMIPTFGNSNLLYFGGQTQTLSNGYNSRWLRTINLPFLKQFSRRMDAKRILKKWAMENKKDGVILTYSVPPFLVRDLIKTGKKYGIKTVAIIADLPCNMYINHKKNKFLYAIRQKYLNSALKWQGEFDGYIYLTKHMRDVISKDKPYIVMEGILNSQDEEFKTEDKTESKEQIKAVMYAGRLHEKFGVKNLIDAFNMLKDIDAQLWLFGDGTMVEEIKNIENTNPRIRYFGSLPREEILKYEKKATLLVNPRSPHDQFTKYSFPSKTIEYMNSGTPLLTTKLEGIGEEYFEYVFSIDNNSTQELKNALYKILNMSFEELSSVGEKARQFILEQKNAKVQALKIIKFLEQINGEKL